MSLRLGSLTEAVSPCRSRCSNSAWWAAKDSRCKDSCLLGEGMGVFHNVYQFFRKLFNLNWYRLIGRCQKMYRGVPCFLHPGFSNVSISRMVWYKKLTLAEYSELDNRLHLDLTSFICTFWGDWHLQIENTQYWVPQIFMGNVSNTCLLSIPPHSFLPSFVLYFPPWLPSLHMRTSLVLGTVLCVEKIGEGRQSWQVPPSLPPSPLLRPH